MCRVATNLQPRVFGITYPLFCPPQARAAVGESRKIGHVPSREVLFQSCSWAHNKQTPSQARPE